MTVGDICNRNVVVAPASEMIVDAAKRMRTSHVGDLVVVETRNGRHLPVGIITDRDIVISVVAGDPDPLVRLTVARALAALKGPAPSLGALTEDPDEQVRAAASVAVLLRGEAERLPAAVTMAAAATAAAELVAVDTLRLGVQTEPDAGRRRAMALVLALLDPEAGRRVAAKDPAPEVRRSVAVFMDPSLLAEHR